MKNTLITVGVLVVLAVIIGVVFSSKKHEVQNSETVAMCYSYAKKTASGLTDRAWLHMDIAGDKVTGEYRNLPVEKDSKTGTFEGTVGAMNPATSSRIADVMWNVSAEGMTVMEQLRIEFGEGSAVALFGAIKDRGDGVYVYEDTSKLTPGFQMSQVDCGQLTESTTVESYIRTNIVKLADENASLGGTWRVTSIDVDAHAHNGSVTYEDGHTSRFAIFTYAFDQVSKKISITSFSGTDK